MTERGAPQAGQREMKLSFTSGEKDVLRRLMRGDTAGEIAQALGLSLRTIESKLHQMREKTHARNTVQLIAMSAKAGWHED